MPFANASSFSPDDKYFACFNSEDKLLVWETENTSFVQCKYDSNVHSTCTCMQWIPPHYKHASPKKAKTSENSPKTYILALGTAKGDVLLYNVSNKNLMLHLASRHKDAVNDMYFYNETKSFFTCSNDKSIAIWDITSGNRKSQWKVDDCPTALCVINDNNMLSASKSILLWNIAEKSVIKEFNSHSSEIFKLLPVNHYFVSVATKDKRINAWSLTSTEDNPVATFVLPDQPVDIDISNPSSKNKPLILASITKEGVLHLFEHMLNGNVNEAIQSKVSTAISSELTDASIISTKISTDTEFCIVACGSSKSNMSFKRIKMKDLLDQSKIQCNDLSNAQPLVKLVKEVTRKHSINGVKTLSNTEISPKLKNIKERDEVISSCKRKSRSPSHLLVVIKPDLNIQETEDSRNRHKISTIEVDMRYPKSCVNEFLEALQTQNKNITNVILSNGDTEFINSFVENLPTSSLKDVLNEIKHNLQYQHSPTLSKWIKEILRVHLNYLIQSQDTKEALNCIKTQIGSMKVSETLSKLLVLKGFLSLQIQNTSSEESDSENERPMEL